MIVGGAKVKAVDREHRKSADDRFDNRWIDFVDSSAGQTCIDYFRDGSANKVHAQLFWLPTSLSLSERLLAPMSNSCSAAASLDSLAGAARTCWVGSCSERSSSARQWDWADPLPGSFAG